MASLNDTKKWSTGIRTTPLMGWFDISWRYLSCGDMISDLQVLISLSSVDASLRLNSVCPHVPLWGLFLREFQLYWWRIHTNAIVNIYIDWLDHVLCCRLRWSRIAVPISVTQTAAETLVDCWVGLSFPLMTLPLNQSNHMSTTYRLCHWWAESGVWGVSGGRSFHCSPWFLHRGLLCANKSVNSPNVPGSTWSTVEKTHVEPT